MSSFHRAAPGSGIVLAAVVLAAMSCVGLTGCASAPASALSAQLGDEVRRLTMLCYWSREGERQVAGPLPVYTACHHWARRQVQVRMPALDASLRD